jgi:hypothetical protein
MDQQSIFAQHKIRAKEIFEEATFEEFFGNYLFETSDQAYYEFASNEHGAAAWLNQDLEPIKVEEERRSYLPAIVPLACSFNHCEPIDSTLFEDKRFSDIEARIRHGGKSLAQKANKAYMDVLNAAVSDRNLVSASGQNLDELLADVFSLQVNAGFRPDRFILPQHLEAKLVQLKIVLRDNAISSSHYVGKTISGQNAFWSEHSGSGTILMFDSNIGITLTKKPKFATIERLEAFTAGVCGYLSLNPIIKNTQGVIAITHVDQILARRTGGTSTVQIARPITYVESGRIDELKALDGSKFDLTKLVRLCEELNTCYANESYLAVTMLTRAVLDHVPPIFGYKTFAEVANNFGGKSLRKSLQNLQNSSRNISDTYLHLPIRNKESLPNRTQVDSSNDIDVLLAEIIRILR